jgi:uncharacterized protein YciW
MVVVGQSDAKKHAGDGAAEDHSNDRLTAAELTMPQLLLSPDRFDHHSIFRLSYANWHFC